MTICCGPPLQPTPTSHPHNEAVKQRNRRLDYFHCSSRTQGTLLQCKRHTEHKMMCTRGGESTVIGYFLFFCDEVNEGFTVKGSCLICQDTESRLHGAAQHLHSRAYCLFWKVYSSGFWTMSCASRFGLAVRRQAGKQRDLCSNPLWLSFLFKNCGL